MKLSRINGSELVGFAGAAILLGSLWLNWFSTSCDAQGRPLGCNGNSTIHGMQGSFDAFQTYSILRWLLVAAADEPFVLAYIIARGHELTWRPGEITMIVGMVAFVLILVNGIVFGRPGDNSSTRVQIALQPGYFVGLGGALLIALGGFLRQAKSVRSRKPPGVM